MAANMILLPSIFTSLLFFSLFSVASQDQQNNNHDLLDHELRDVKLKHSLLESVLEENINAKTHYVKGFEKSLEDRATKTTFLQSALSNLKNHSLLADERIKALEEEVHHLWAVSRKNNFDLHVLESKAQDAKDRLEVVTSQVEKMAEVVTEQWIQIQHLEQALQIAEMRALQAQRERNMRCTFLKTSSEDVLALDSYSLGKGTIIKSYMSQALQQLRRFYWAIKKFHHETSSEDVLALDSYSLGKGTIIKSYMSQALQQLRRFYWAIKKFHHELQGFIKQEMQRNEVAATFVNDELIFVLASAFITFPILGAWMLLLSRFG
ncbi:hypothetical protein V6N11_003113 [Hibiscus sabdariffa]|uniref:Uncharacterized protein n=1 Tax=Hibiscus sabdariffa TaxID=183260 RepID=A0ABR2SCH2_9ROSI